MNSLSTAFLTRMSPGKIPKLGLDGERWPCVQVPSCSGHPSREPCTPSQRLGTFRAGARGSRCTKDEALVCLYALIQFSKFRRDEKMCKKVLHVTWSPQTGPQSTPPQDGRRGKAQEFNKPQLSSTSINCLKGSLGISCKSLSGENKKNLPCLKA